MTPIVTRFWLLKIAVGGVGESKSSSVARRAVSSSWRPSITGTSRVGDAGAAEFLEEAAASLARGLDHGPVAEVGDAAVAALEEVAGRERGAVGVVAHDGVGRDARGLAVDEDHGRAAAELGCEVGLALGHGGEDEPVDAPAEERGDRLLLAVGIVVEARGEDRDAARERDVLDGTVHRAGERVVDAADEEPERAGAPVGAAQVPGVQVGLVVEGAGRGVDLRDRRGRDVRLAVDDARDGLHADAGERGDVPHRRAGARAIRR